MSLFGTSSSLNADIEKTTSENNTTENWGLILDICDRVNNGSATPKDCLKCIIKRLNSPNPHVVMKGITLLDACVNNCGKQFHLEVASREFETEFKKLLQKSQPKVTTKLKLTLKRWAEDVFKSDPQLDLIPSLYRKLRDEGHDFSDPSATPKRETTLSKDPNVVSSQQEEDDIAKAIELSLKEVKNTQSPKMMSSSGTTASSLYPSALLSTAPVAEPRKVRALYDFEAAEDNELTFQAGEIIMVLDDSDPNWWKGQNQRGEGLFPSNFVTADLSVEPESLTTTSGKGTKKSVQFSDEQKSDGDKDGQQKHLQSATVEINEEKIDRLLHLIHEADPEDPSQDTEEMLQLEQLVNQMGPMIDAELERVDRKHAQLTQLSSDLVDAINLYHNLMREPDRSAMMSMGGGPSYGTPGGYTGGPMNPMYGMPAMYQSLPGVGMYPMGGGPPSLPTGQAMAGYNMSHLRHDMSQMNVGTMPQFPTPAQQAPPQPAMHQHHHQQQPMQGGGPMQTISQNGPTTNGMLSQVGPTTSMAGVSNQQQPNTSATPQTMPNMTGPPMQQQQLGAIPQGFANPTSPPPVGMPGPHHQLQQVPPNPNQQALPQMRPAGGQQQQQQPPVSYQNYGPQQQQQQQQQHQPPLSQPVPQNVAPQGMQPGVPVSGGPPPPTSTQSIQPNLNHHPNQHVPMSMPPAHYPPTSGAPNHHHQQQQQQQPQQQQQFMGMGPPMGNFGPMGAPMNMFPPSGPGVVGGPLSINTNHQGPQNIPIYQQQR